MDRYVNVISGLPRTGKSYLLKDIKRQPEYLDAVIVRMDKVGRRLYGKRQATRAGSTTTELTPIEKIFRNDETRLEMRRQLVAYNAGVILMETPLLTREYHQQPLVEIVANAQWYIGGIEKELADRNSQPLPSKESEVHLKVVLLYASPDVVRERFEKESKRKIPTANSDAGHINIFLDAAVKFQFPDSNCYVPLLVDTTEESHAAHLKRVEEVSSFLRGDILPEELLSINSKRMPKAVAYLEEARRQAGIAGIVRL